MGRKSTISRLAPGVKKYVEKLLREDRLTLDEMIADLQAKYPLLAQMVTTVCTNAAMGAQERDDLTIKEVGDLSRAARAAMETRTLSLRERLAAEEAGRQKLLAEQREKLDAMGTKGGVTEDTKRAIREALGIV